MSAPVDVLRRIDQTDAALSCAGLDEQDILRVELREARAAMAELIEATRNLVAESVHPYDGGEYEDGEWAALDQARAALARAGGAS